MINTVFLGLFLVAAPLVIYGRTDSSDCLRYGGGSCCPDLEPLDVDLRESARNQPFYVSFVAVDGNNDLEYLDNVCFTLFPVPDDSETFLLYVSRVYCDGRNDIYSFLISQPDLGLRRIGNGLCMYSDTVFAQIGSEDAGGQDCDVRVYHRCILSGDCPGFFGFESQSTVYGLSNIRRKIGISCLNRAKTAIIRNGLPLADLYILPMRLPSRCVLNQVCTVAPTLHRFCQTVGVAFPVMNRCANLRVY